MPPHRLPGCSQVISIENSIRYNDFELFFEVIYKFVNSGDMLSPCLTPTSHAKKK